MRSLLFILWCTLSLSAFAQQPVFTEDDSLRGSITPERVWWDLHHYQLNLSVDPATTSIAGNVVVAYTVVEPYQVLQIDLQPPLVVEKITQDGEPLDFTKRGNNAHMVTLKKEQQKGAAESVVVYYSGKPLVARNPPWQGGFQWAKDNDGNPFIATSCQGLGASVWWPCKDHMYDEPDSMTMNITVPANLVDVSNGRLRSKTQHDNGTVTFGWFVRNPINNYGVNVNIANYVHFSDTLRGEGGILDLDFYVLPYNLEKAREQFKQAKLMLRAFEYWFGPYPFYEDGYKLVETPYLGMEHQSSVTYGNGYQNGYRGRDLSASGWGLKWDFIIIHESGHEWFANNITYKDIADMWVHESFTNYSENLYTEYYYGKKAGAEYVIGTRKSIKNDRPIVGPYNVNKSGSGDMYSKGGNMLHTLRQVFDNDERWRRMLRDMNKTFYHQTVTGKQIEDFITRQCGRDLGKVFDQYLRDVRIPEFTYTIKKGKLQYRWSNCVEGFDMPVKISSDNGKTFTTIYPTTSLKSLDFKGDTVTVDENFYVTSKQY
jgi:aminopeptidase N